MSLLHSTDAAEFTSQRRIPPSGGTRATAWGWQGACMAVVMMGLVMTGCEPPADPSPDSLYVRDMSEGFHNTTPVRGNPILGLRVGEDAFACSMCHEGFTGELQEQALVGQHAHIDFNHGMNLDCLNCHNPADSDSYVYHDGSTIPADEPNRLCAKCHGPQYRNWTYGTHGRRGGYWSADHGEQKPLDCIQCHDPHRPHFQLMQPDPPPRLTRFEKAVTRAIQQREDGESDDV